MFAGMRRGKCTNHSGCLLAYRGEEVDVVEGQPFLCSECQKPLAEVKGGAGRLVGIGALVALLFTCAFGVLWASWPKIKTRLESKAPSSEKTPPPVVKTAAEPVATPAPAEPASTVAMPAKIDLDISKSETRKVKDEVLTRVDLMPITAANKDKLYNSVERARQMGKVLTIPFASGKTSLAGNDVQAIKAELDKPDLAKLRDDPTAVFVILGFADPSGDAKKNLQISQQRADAVLAAMRDKCAVANVLHAVAMGGSTLLDAQNVEKNRVVEVWAVLP